MGETMDKYSARRAVCASIVEILTNDPEAMGEVLLATTQGMRGAIDRAKEAAAQKDRAMLAALGLALPQRVDAETRALLSGIVASGCNHTSPCRLEEQAIRAALPPTETQNG